MKQRIINLITFNLLALFAVLSAQAQWTTNRPYRVSDTQLRNVVTRIENKTDRFKNQMTTALNQSRWNSTSREDDINAMISDFENATDRLRSSIGSTNAYNNEANDVLTRAAYINQFMARNRLNVTVQNQWASLRTDLNTLANYYNLGWNWNQTLPPYTAGNRLPSSGYSRASESQVRNLISRIETKTDTFKRHMDNTFDRNRWNNTNADENISAIIDDFENATDRLRTSIGVASYNNEANDVLLRANYIDQFMRRNRLNATAERQWASLRTDLNTLAGYYNLSWNWNQSLPPFVAGNYPGTINNGRIGTNLLTGTYRLNTSLSDNVSEVVSRSINVYSTTDRPNFGRNLERRLSSPNMMAIERVGRDVTIASSNAPQVTFSADGVARRETNERGRTVTTTVTTVGPGITINYQGDRNNDFYVTFTPVRNDQLRVTRRLYLPNRNQTITVSSVYDKIDTVARWSDVNVNNTGAYNDGINNNTFGIPNGTRITAVLRSAINTKATQVGDRFTMEVTSPNEYRGAIIEGNVSNIDRSGRVSGRANISMDFDTIRMPDGRSYRFEGIVDAVRTANGETVSVNNEGVVRDSNQTTKTVTRAGIGAALGAIIGAIAGGGQGAAIGAAVGAGAGAGSVLIQGRDNMELGPGTEFSITSSAPGGVGYINR